MTESVVSVVIADWHVASGDLVTVDQLVVTLETDKAAVEIRAPVIGVISTLYGRPHLRNGIHLAREGDTLLVDAPLYSIRTDIQQPLSRISVQGALA